MESNVDDDFKWFGEGFNGFPKRLPEDTVKYAIYAIDAKLEGAQRISQLKDALQDINSFTKDLLKNYIWQRDTFSLELKLEEGSWSLQGTTNYGDSIADEWLIVYILVETSMRHPNLWIRVYDTDGEFLLIEAANVLPKWLKPEVSENRVWIHAGEIKIIPSLPQTSLASRAPSLSEALSFIKSNQTQLFRSRLIETEAFYRIKKYPGSIANQFHESLVTLPRKLAYILHHNATYISPAVEAFYLRDPISLKPLLSSNSTALSFPPDDLVTTSVRFTRVGYAQLKSQEFNPPPTWSDIIKEKSSNDQPRAMIGMKLTCGFEMLMSDKLHQDKRAVREIGILLEDLDSGDEQLPTDKEIATWSRRDDNDGWMDIDFNDFERELAGKSANAANTGEGFGDKAAQESLKKLVSRFEDFLNDEDAGVDGAEIDETDSDDDDDDDDRSSHDEDRDVSFDEKEFEHMMREMLGLSSQSTNLVSTSNPHENIADDEDDSIDDEDVKEVMEGMETELKETGVLNLDPPHQKSANAKGKERAITDGNEIGVAKDQHQPDNEDEDEKGDVHVDFTLAKNMLEAFKSQGGMAGPAGNLMGLMGVRLPPDKEEDS